MANEPMYLTRDGLIKLQQELEFLKGPARKEISERLRAAISMGDLSENADYHKAKEDQGFLEGRIQELDQVVSGALIIDEIVKNTNEVSIGDTITIQEDDFPQEIYFLVGPKEADPTQGKISYESPIGKALLSHKVGDAVAVQTPGGQLIIKIIKIE